ncbi:MAG: radical SAM protein [Candidatus Firestonebacteria bacterium]
MKVLLVQLPITSFVMHWENYYSPPLALGYLKAFAYKEGLLDKIQVEILDPLVTDLSGDAFLIDVITTKKPDVIGFSCYNWNLMRSLDIAKKIKNILPSVQIIVGGPEATRDNELLIANSYVDIIVCGEGEVTFVELLKYFYYRDAELENIDGIIFRSNGKAIKNNQRKLLMDLNEIPSPYLSKFITPSKSKYMILETIRGCPYRCGYCYYGKNYPVVRCFSLDRVEKELQLAKESQVSYVYIMDSLLNLNENRLKRLCGIIKKINADKKIIFQTEIKAEKIDSKTAKIFAECNIKILEVGLQSTNPEALANVNRKYNFKKYVQGVHLLKKQGLEVVTGVIAGLPGDSKSDIKKSVDFLIKNNITSTINIYPLCVLPGTSIRENAKKFKIKFQKEPPYYVLKTAKLSTTQIREAINSSLNNKTVSDEWYPSFITHSAGGYLKYHLSGKMPDLLFNVYGNDNCVTKVIIPVNLKLKKKLKSIVEELKNKVSVYLTLWFKCGKYLKNPELIENFINTILTANPHIGINVILEADVVPDNSIIERIKQVLKQQNNYLTQRYYYGNRESVHSRRVFIVAPFARSKKNSVKIPVFFYVKVNTFDDIESINNFDCTGVLLDFQRGIKGEFLYKVFDLLKSKNSSNKIIRFLNWPFQRLWNIEIQKENQPFWLEEKIMEFDNNLNSKITGLDYEKSFMDTVEWKLNAAVNGEVVSEW